VAQSFTDAVVGGLEEAKALETYMMAMLKSLQSHHEKMAVSHEHALQTVVVQIHTEAQAVTSQIAAAVISFAALHNDLVSFVHMLGEPELSLAGAFKTVGCRNLKPTRKDPCGMWIRITGGASLISLQDMERLEHMADSLSHKYSAHEGSLSLVHQRAMDITNTLESAASSATAFHGYLSRGFSFAGLWPYIFCPVASLWMGSYGLPPSAARNLALISIGRFCLSTVH
jgi:hypothetical protein